ncbi:MAG TPA: peptidoglycan-binding domain-containing protein [Candidatus Paceibacterota bacterium]|nr:peptidoglycan-binding domain-containing protein [Candidatus Paceibacterota bacterium]
MRASLYLPAVALLALSSAVVASAQTTAPRTFATNLSLGSIGIEVTTLQKLLNQDPATSVAATGPGSPGNETDYFGSLTQAAVIRFQEKYASAVLVPAGLSSGNGYVGSYTRAELDALAAAPAPETVATLPVTPAAATTTPVTPTPPASAASTGAAQNPNLKNIDTIFADVDKVGAAQGMSSSTLAVVKARIMQRLATTTDLQAAFLKKVQDTSPHQAIEDTSFPGRVLATIERAFDSVFMPEQAQAAVAMPFGGAVLATLPCDGDIWNVYVEPLPPTFVVTLSYVGGSQAFLSYNVPFTTHLLGEYEPVPMAYCWLGIYPVPSEGMITPIVGSAPL